MKAGLTTEHRRFRLLGEAPLVREVGVRRVAVDHHDRRAQEQRRHERVPHHPGGRREPLQPVAGLQVPAERVVLLVLEQNPAVAVNDRLREAGRARGEEHVERVRERQRLELERPFVGEKLAPRRERRRARAPGTEPRRRPRGSAARRGPRPPARAGRRAARPTCSPQRQAAASARAGRGGRGRCARRTRAGTSPRSRRGWRRRGTRRASPGCSAGTQPPGRPRRSRAAADRHGHAPPARGARRT